MSKLLIIYEQFGPTVSMVLDRMILFGKRYNSEIRHSQSMHINNNDIKWCDVIISVRSYSNLDNEIVKIAKKYGRYHILVIDDNFLCFPEGYVTMSDRQCALRSILSITDHIQTDNRVLGEYMCSYSKKAKYSITNTIVNNQEINQKRREKNQDFLKILYYVNDASLFMFDKIIRPALPQLVEEFGYKISFTFMAVHPDMSEYEGRVAIRYIDHMSLKDFRYFLKTEEFDIGLAPLDNCLFSQCKYFNKYLEFTMAGIMGIYSNTLPYSEVIKDKVNGLLCINSPESWLRAIRSAITNTKLRQECVRNAQAHLVEKFNADTIIEQMKEDIPELTKYNATQYIFAPPIIFAKLSHILFKVKEYLFFGYHRIKKSGIRLTIYRLKKRIKMRYEYQKGSL